MGTPLDFITFHAKGQPRLVNGMVQMNMGKQLRDIDKGFEIVASYPTLKKLPIIAPKIAKKHINKTDDDCNILSIS